MTNELFEKIANEVKSQITRLNIQENFMLFKADEFGFSNTVIRGNNGNVYTVMYGMEIVHPLTGYRVIFNSNIEDIEIVVNEIVGLLVHDFTEYFNATRANATPPTNIIL